MFEGSAIVRHEDNQITDQEIVQFLSQTEDVVTVSTLFPQEPQKLPKSASPIKNNLTPAFQKVLSPTKPEPSPQQLPETAKLQIIYEGRDILDLQTNTNFFNWPLRPSKDTNVKNYYKFSEVNNKNTVVRKMRDKNDGAYYYCFPPTK